MSIRDDEQFEEYLKQFRPVTPEALLMKKQVKARRRPLLTAAWAAVAAAILLSVMAPAFLRWLPHRPGEDRTSKPGVEELNNPQLLTIAKANVLLAQATSFNAAVDNMAFQPESKPISEGRYSALALLSEEETK